MIESRLQTGLRYAAAALLAAMVLCTINVPAHSMVADPRIGTTSELKHTPDPTREQLERQQANPRVAAPVRNAEPEREVEAPEIPSGPEPTVVMAALEGAKESGAAKGSQSPKRATTMLGLALTAAILGLLCVGGMVVAKYGPKAPPPPSPEPEREEYEIGS